MIAITDRKLLYIDPVKTASQEVDNFILKNKHSSFKILVYSETSVKHRRIIPDEYKDYDLFATIRNPYTRAMSAWRQYYYLKHVIHVWIPPSHMYKAKTFEDFLEHLLKIDKEYSDSDDLGIYRFFNLTKWFQNYDMSKMEFIRVESLKDDLIRLFPEVELEKLEKCLHRKNKTNHLPNLSKTFSKEAIEMIKIWAKDDFENFGYDPDEIPVYS